jgi:NADPH-dependent glutamate synthase beta subunit-like oxidoreductase
MARVTEHTLGQDMGYRVGRAAGGPNEPVLADELELSSVDVAIVERHANQGGSE